MKSYFWFALVICAQILSPSEAAFAYNAMALPGSLFSVLGEPKVGLSSKTDIGFSSSAGNSESDQLTVGELTSYRWEIETLQVQGRYLEVGANQVQSTQNWMLGARYERKLLSGLGAFAGESVEADRFAGLSQRYSTDLGLRRNLWWETKLKTAAEVGYRYQFENRSNGQLRAQIIRVFLESAYTFDKISSVAFANEFLPDLSDLKNFRWNSELDFSANITAALSFGTSYSVRYNTVPAGNGLLKLDRSLLTKLSAAF